MKTLFINRHAKSSWSHKDKKDFDRPLNSRGLRDAPFMAKTFKMRNEKIDKIVSSPAMRAFTTATLFATELDISESDIIKDKRIYEASSNQLAKVVEGFDDKWNSVIIFGHNPGFSNLVDYYTSEYVDMPTCGIAKVVFDVDSWKEVFRGTGKLEMFDYPKNYKELQ